MSETRLCVNCGKSVDAAKYKPGDVVDGCVDPETGYAGCALDMTAEEAWVHWKGVAHERYVRVKRLARALGDLIEALDNCPRYEKGAGGMTIDAQISRTRINQVPASAVEAARDVLEAE